MKTFSASAKRLLFKNITGWLFISPVVLGLLIFTLWPMLSSLYYSFTKYDVLSAPEWVGFKNYIKIFTVDKGFLNALWITLKYTIIVVPATTLLSFALALLLAGSLKGINAFRTIIYLPCIIPGVVSSLLWLDVFSVDYGIANRILNFFGIQNFPWLTDYRTALPSMMFMTLWGLGGGMVIWIASIRSIPESFYESAKLEGISWPKKIWHITIPMCSPVIFYNLVMSIIGTFQTFGPSFIMTNGGPNDSTTFYVLKVYNDAFVSLKMGYASALSWVLFIIILILTLVVFKTSGWVYYGEDTA